MNLDLLSQLSATWDAAGVKHAAPPTPEAIAAFEARYDVSLPADFRAYLETLNGAQGGRDDMTSDQTVAFWRLDEIEPENVGRVRVFPFADYLIDSHRYVLALSSNPTAATPVFIHHSNETLIRITESFTAFLRAYLAADEGILHAAPVSSGPSA